MAKGLTQEVVAAHAGVAVSTYSLYENGHRSIPFEVAERIASFVECSLDEIFLPQKFTVSKSREEDRSDQNSM